MSVKDWIEDSEEWRVSAAHFADEEAEADAKLKKAQANLEEARRSGDAADVHVHGEWLGIVEQEQRVLRLARRAWTFLLRMSPAGATIADIYEADVRHAGDSTDAEDALDRLRVRGLARVNGKWKWFVLGHRHAARRDLEQRVEKLEVAFAAWLEDWRDRAEHLGRERRA